MSGSEGNTVIAWDVGRPAALFKTPFRHGESVVFLGGRQGFTGERKTPGVIGDRQRIAVLVIPKLRNGHICCWCQVEKGQLMVIPHPQSRYAVRHFDYPSQPEMVCRLTGVAMRIVHERETEREAPSHGRHR